MSVVADGQERRVAVVMGAGPGIGTSLARRLGLAGWGVGLLGRREGPLAELGTALQDEGVEVGWAAVDIADETELTAAIQRFGTHRGRLDLLHHNVSASRPVTATQTSSADLLADLAAGAASLLTGVRAVLPFFPGGRGTVTATGSGAADHPMASAATVGVQKAALRNLVQVLDAELRERGVRVAMLEVHGVLARGGVFDPDRVAEALVALVGRADGPPDDWRPVVPYPQ